MRILAGLALIMLATILGYIFLFDRSIDRSTLLIIVFAAGVIGYFVTQLAIKSKPDELE